MQHLQLKKNHFAIYATNLYMEDETMNKLLLAYEQMNVKLNIGKSCIRFTKTDNIPLDTVIEIISSTTVDEYI